MDIKLGEDVMTSDGKRAGKVDRIVIHPDSSDILAIVSHEGHMFGEDRIIGIAHVSSVDADGTVHLNLDEKAALELPHFIRTDFVQPTTAQTHRYGSSTGAVIMPGASSHPYGYTGYDPMGGSLFGPAPASPPNVEAVSNLPEGALIINHGTEVRDKNDEKVGNVDDVLYDDDNNITGFVVHRGHLFRHDVSIPIDWVTSITHDHIWLSKTAEEAESEGKAS